jgi:hypothetical protein
MTLRIIVFSSTILFLAACAEESAEQTTPSEQPEAAARYSAEPAALPRSASADGASVFFITPAIGETVSNPVKIEFGISGMDVVKASIKQPHSGHHHLLIDTDLPDEGLPIPADEHHIHFGDGSTMTEIALPPGEHTLQMLLGDHLHIPHDPPLVSEPLTITVK